MQNRNVHAVDAVVRNDHKSCGDSLLRWFRSISSFFLWLSRFVRNKKLFRHVLVFAPVPSAVMFGAVLCGADAVWWGSVLCCPVLTVR